MDLKQVNEVLESLAQDEAWQQYDSAEKAKFLADVHRDLIEDSFYEHKKKLQSDKKKRTRRKKSDAVVEKVE